MEGSVKGLAVYRFEKAKVDLDTARMNYNNSMYKAAINRSYYSMFHGMRAVTILDGFDSFKQDLAEYVEEELDRYLEML